MRGRSQSQAPARLTHDIRTSAAMDAHSILVLRLLFFIWVSSSFDDSPSIFLFFRFRWVPLGEGASLRWQSYFAPQPEPAFLSPCNGISFSMYSISLYMSYLNNMLILIN